MKSSLWIVLTILTVGATNLQTVRAAETCNESSRQIRVGTFNILNKYVRKNPEKIMPWIERAPLISTWVASQQLDILATQEGLPDMIATLSKNLIDYEVVGQPRSGDPISGETSAILINKKRFSVLNTGTFWLSKTPEIPESKNWDANVTRICTWAEVLEQNSGRRLFILNAHYDHLGSFARTRSSELIFNKIKSLAGADPVVLLGDFNSKLEDPDLEILKSHLIEAKTNSQARPSGPDRTIFYGTIDHVFVSPSLRICQYEVAQPRAPDQRRLSDHEPVIVQLSW